MAGLGETCSHVASLLWAVEAGVHLRDSMYVTQKRPYWVFPPSVKEVPYAPLSRINFQGKAGSLAACRSPDQSIDPPSTSASCITSPTHKSIEPPSAERMDRLFATLSVCSTNPAILSVVVGYSHSYIPKSLAPDLPPVLTVLFKPEHPNMQFSDLLQMAADSDFGELEAV